VSSTEPLSRGICLEILSSGGRAAAGGAKVTSLVLPDLSMAVNLYERPPNSVNVLLSENIQPSFNTSLSPPLPMLTKSVFIIWNSLSAVTLTVNKLDS
jgi:hypothetical protein